MPETTLAAAVRKTAESWPGISRVVGQVDSRDIANSGGKPSEHSFGNALDIYGSRKAMSTLAAELNRTKGQTGVRIVCYDGGPGPKYDRCTTPHIDHIHVDMAPNCGGIVPTTGTASERRNKCEEYQNGRPVTGKPSDNVSDNEPLGGSTGDGFLGIPGAVDRFTTSIETTLKTALFVGIGIALLGAGIALAVKQTDAFKAVKGAAMKVATKGAT